MPGLLAYIRELIEKSGPLTVADYMELALQHPYFGYYRHGDPLGLEGDFTTAPEISQMFGEMLGLWCADVWHQIGAPARFALVELGPGRGTLMQDALRATAKVAGFHQALQLHLMESSASLRKAQEDKLDAHHPHYFADISQLPALPAVILANEFFDALPARQFEKTFTGWAERVVTVEGKQLAFAARPLEAALLNLIPEALRDANSGTVHEVSMPALVLMRDIARHVVQNGGAALIIDYGYIASDGKPTLQAVSGHKYADVLVDPGNDDLTAHVDFNALKTAAVMQNTSVHGPLGQGEFLKALGIDLRALQLKHLVTSDQAKNIDMALTRLTDPAQMGSLFKVMAVAAPMLTDLPGF